MIDNLKIYKESYNFILWIFPVIKSFPKSDKFSIGEKIKINTICFFENIVCILKNYNKSQNLEEADVNLEKIRLYLRICKDLKILSFKKYEIGIKKLDILGKMLGGLFKKNI